MLAVLFPGQGSERAGMGLDLAARWPAARELLDHASTLTGIDLARELARPGAALRRTEVLQPALAAVDLGLWSVFAEQAPGQLVFAGHSLGELCAWSAAGGAGAREALTVAAARGASMAQSAREFPGGMLALTGCDEAGVARALALGRPHGGLDLAAHNAPDEWVLSGDEAALQAVSTRMRGVRLAVSGPWHAATMAGARAGMTAALASVPPRPLRHPLVANATGRPVRDDDEARARLIEGISAPVRWVDSLRALEAAGATGYVILGPGRALRAMVRKTLGTSARIWLAEDDVGLQEALEQLR